LDPAVQVRSTASSASPVWLNTKDVFAAESVKLAFALFDSMKSGFLQELLRKENMTRSKNALNSFAFLLKEKLIYFIIVFLS
jgi:hypothetical protein